ncbi:MAG TPA: pyruvate dehydrogenase (acetyl-transferring) E1 component subunit alpha [Fimbriimonadaceae bacterium]|nr:pyruvate dehydrogenase (acetyl-transferring) E1 component subunit alpha [Fimbriimonadaceae bacterium]
MAKQAVKNATESPAVLEQYYRDMLFIRHFEEKCNLAYRQGKVGGYMHTYIGMEALAVGWLESIRKGEDYVITAYRDHAHALLLGTDPVAVMAELMGRKAGTAGGKGGSMHLFDPEKGLYGGWGIVGGHIPLGAGLAFASKYRGEDRVTLNFMGDGASNQGVVFETMNMAGLWDLPCIFIIENNEFAMGTRLEYHAAEPQLYKRGQAFGIQSERIDGMDVLQMKKDAQRIVDWVRKNQQPYWVEIMTYRYAGHGAADQDRQLYRTKDEEETAWKRDPIKRLEAILLDRKILTPETVEAIDAEIVDQVDKIYEQADASPHPDPSEVYDNIYTDMSVEKGH